MTKPQTKIVKMADTGLLHVKPQNHDCPLVADCSSRTAPPPRLLFIFNQISMICSVSFTVWRTSPPVLRRQRLVIHLYFVSVNAS